MIYQIRMKNRKRCENASVHHSRSSTANLQTFQGGSRIQSADKTLHISKCHLYERWVKHYSSCLHVGYISQSKTSLNSHDGKNLLKERDRGDNTIIKSPGEGGEDVGETQHPHALTCPLWINYARGGIMFIHRNTGYGGGGFTRTRTRKITLNCGSVLT